MGCLRRLVCRGCVANGVFEKVSGVIKAGLNPKCFGNAFEYLVTIHAKAFGSASTIHGESPCIIYAYTPQHALTVNTIYNIIVETQQQHAYCRGHPLVFGVCHPMGHLPHHH